MEKQTKSETYYSKSFIHNEWIGSDDKNIIVVKDKYSQKEIAHINCANKLEIEKAIESSVDGFNRYKKLNVQERAEILNKMYEELLNQKEDFAQLMVLEAGKPIDLARAEIDRSLGILQACSRLVYDLSGEMVPMNFLNGVGKTAYTKMIPVGPVLAISPFNFPLNLVLHKLAPALAVGCSVILKPSAYTPLTSLKLAELCKKVGLPAGVFNVVICQNEEASLLLADERLKYFSFTGSDKVGWELKSKAGKKKVTLELGGNAAVIVDKSTNVKEIAKAVANGAFSYAGQVCISTQRVYVEESIFEEFKTAMIFETKGVKVGNPHESGVTVGPMIEDKHIERINNWIAEAKQMGAEVVVGGEVFDKKHNMYAPTILTKTTKKMKIVSEEAFAPVMTLEKFNDFEKVVAEVNSSRYGLQAGVFTNQIAHMKYLQENLEVGGIIMNGVPSFRMDTMPYGGVKDSGLGREGIKYAAYDMLETRLIVF